MREYRWLLFDMDDTLFDFDAAEEYALTRLFRHYALPEIETAKAVYRSINAAVWEEFSATMELSQLFQLRFQRFFAAMDITGDPQEWNDRYLLLLSECPQLLPGAEELCRELAETCQLAVITNGLSHSQHRRLDASPLKDLFPHERRFISGDMELSKPDPAYFEKVLTSLGVTDPRHVLVIGDSLTSDIQGAANAGLDCVWLNAKGKAPGAHTPTYTISELTELRRLLLSREG